MLPTSVSFLSLGCTRVLDTAITVERARYAADRVDFHTFFAFQTVPALQQLLRGSPRGDNASERQTAVFDLLHAQREAPHALWTLLLVQAFEAKLVARRRALSTAPDAALDALVVDTFVAALDGIPEWAEETEMSSHVLRVSARALRRAVGVKRPAAARVARAQSEARTPSTQAAPLAATPEVA